MRSSELTLATVLLLTTAPSLAQRATPGVGNLFFYDEMVRVSQPDLNLFQDQAETPSHRWSFPSTVKSTLPAEWFRTASMKDVHQLFWDMVKQTQPQNMPGQFDAISLSEDQHTALVYNIADAIRDGSPDERYHAIELSYAGVYGTLPPNTPLSEGLKTHLNEAVIDYLQDSNDYTQLDSVRVALSWTVRDMRTDEREQILQWIGEKPSRLVHLFRTVMTANSSPASPLSDPENQAMDRVIDGLWLLAAHAPYELRRNACSAMKAFPQDRTAQMLRELQGDYDSVATALWQSQPSMLEKYRESGDDRFVEIIVSIVEGDSFFELNEHSQAEASAWCNAFPVGHPIRDRLAEAAINNITYNNRASKSDFNAFAEMIYGYPRFAERIEAELEVEEDEHDALSIKANFVAVAMGLRSPADP